MTSAVAFLARVVEMLSAAGIPHMLAGSFASAYHGTPRTTQDVDLVIDPSPEGLQVFVSRAETAGFYVDPNRARDALERRRQFNVLEPQSGWKADLIVRKDRPFSREEFARREPATILGAEVFVASPEDTILAKLEWSARTDSERQLADATGIVANKGEGLDRAYIERWAAELGVRELWRRIAG